MSWNLKVFWLVLGLLSFFGPFVLGSLLYGVSDINWKFFLIERLLVILLVIFIGGLAVGLIPFKKLRYKERLFVTIPVVSFMFPLVLLLGVVEDEYGLMSEYNYFTAKRDLSQGKVQLVSVGLEVDVPDNQYISVSQKQEAAIERQFGFKSINNGCMSSDNGWIHYNAVMREYLEEKNGKDWQKKLWQKMDSVRNVNRVSVKVP